MVMVVMAMMVVFRFRIETNAGRIIKDSDIKQQLNNNNNSNSNSLQ